MKERFDRKILEAKGNGSDSSSDSSLDDTAKRDIRYDRLDRKNQAYKTKTIQTNFSAESEKS